MSQQRSRGRPSKAVVTREKIAQAALQIVGVSGYSGLTMAAVARSLGVAPSALYNHVKGKDELMLLVEDELMAQVDTTALQECLDGRGGAREAVKGWARSYRDVFAQHTPLIATIAVTPIRGTKETIAMYELVVQVLLAAGIPEPDVMDTIVALESFIFGSAYDVGAPENIFDVPADQLESSEGVHGLRAALEHRRSAGDSANPYAGRPFELGLEQLVNGLIPA